MDRRQFLAATTAGMSAAAAGCVEAFQSLEGTTYGREPPLVDPRPNAIYWPTHTEAMHHGEVAETDDGLALHLMYTFPHRFWQVISTDEGYGTQKFEVGPDDAVHIMVGVWDAETEVVFPVSSLNVAITGGDGVDERETIYPMLSQRMGFHYGDNYHLDGDDSYTVEVTVGGVDVNRFGEFEGRFGDAETISMELDYSETERNDLEFEMYDDRQGQRGAVEPMGMDGHSEMDDAMDDHDGMDDDDHDEMNDNDHDEMDDGGHDMHHQMPLGFVHDLEAAGGEPMGEAMLDDIRYRAALFDDERFGDEPYLAVTAATRYNDLSIPEMGLAVHVGSADETVEIDVVAEDIDDFEPEDDDEPLVDAQSPTEPREIQVVDPDSAVLSEQLEPGLDPEIGFHYGVSAPELNGGEDVTVDISTPTQVARHEGYETVFFDTQQITLE